MSTDTGVWLLELDLGGQPWRVATEAVTTTQDHGVDLVWDSGLEAIDFATGSRSARLTIRSSAETTWPLERRRQGPFARRAGKLWRWYSGESLDDAELVLQGCISAASWGDPSSPRVLQLTLECDTVALGRLMPEHEAQVSSRTWAAPSEEIIGAHYPIIIGSPGGNGSGTPGPASSGLVVVTAGWTTIVADGQVAATTVRLYDRLGNAANRTVSTTTDLLGRTVSTITIGGGVPAAAGKEYSVGWSRSNPGVVHRGRNVVGLGDVLLYGAETWSRATYDLGEMESRRLRLNRYSIDMVIQDRVRWSEVVAHLLDSYEVEEVQGRRGIYYREINWEPRREQARMHLVTDPTAGAVLVQRDGAMTETSPDDITNQTHVEYDPSEMSRSRFRGLVVIDWDNDLRCRWSRQHFRRRGRTWQLTTACTAATATVVAQVKTAKHVLPWVYVPYTGGDALRPLQRQDTVTVTDTRPGAYISDEVGVVESRVLRADGTVRIVVRIQPDPLRLPIVDG